MRRLLGSLNRRSLRSDSVFAVSFSGGGPKYSAFGVQRSRGPAGPSGAEKGEGFGRRAWDETMNHVPIDRSLAGFELDIPPNRAGASNMSFLAYASPVCPDASQALRQRMNVSHRIVGLGQTKIIRAD